MALKGHGWIILTINNNQLICTPHITW